MLAYLRKLLDQNQDWFWTQIEAIPMEGGFLKKWLARIPLGEKIVECIDVCFVQFDDRGKIRRNEVYFDRTQMMLEMSRLRQAKKDR